MERKQLGKRNMQKLSYPRRPLGHPTLSRFRGNQMKKANTIASVVPHSSPEQLIRFRFFFVPFSVGIVKIDIKSSPPDYNFILFRFNRIFLVFSGELAKKSNEGSI